MSGSPTGEQYHLQRSGPNGVIEADITQVAAGIRVLRVGGFDLTEPFPADAQPTGSNGIVLAPWPNRVGNARWTLDGQAQQLDITEPARGNALHGLLRFTPYRLAEQTESTVTQEATVYPQHGWPFLLETRVRHELVDDGIRVTHEVVNRSARPAPFGVGVHPYLRVGDAPLDDATVTLRAGSAYATDDRLIPVGLRPVGGTPFDLRSGRRIADSDLDTAYADIEADDNGVRHTVIQVPSGDGVEVWQDASFPYVQVFTTRSFARASGPGLAVAAEPMTAAPDALNTGDGLRWLEPDESWNGTWGLRRIRG